MTDPVSLFVGPLVNSIVEDTKSLMKQKYHLLKYVEEDVDRLSSKLSAIQAVVEDAEEKQLDSKPVRDWLGKLQEAALDAEDLIETFATEASLWERKKKVPFALPLSTTRVSGKLDAAQKIKKVLARLDEIAKEKEQLHLNVFVNSRLSDDRNTSFDVDTSDVFGRKDDKNRIIDLLLSEELHKAVIPIIGMGGLGKTTLAQLVYNDDRVKSHFEFQMWVCVTDSFQYRRVLKQMIEYHSEMNYDINLLSDNQLVSRLLDVLSDKCFLLVLDDVWNESYKDWEKLKNILAKGGNGCRVLVTSRTTRVSDVMGTQPPYLLDYLPEKECWSLFKKVAFSQCNLTGNVRRDLEDVGREIVRKCGGLPLAVKAMGGLLRGKYDLNKWRRILKHEIWELEEQNATTGNPIVLPALRLSYDHLPPHLKHCFSYCYIFPKAYVFRKMELVKIWKAASLIQPRGLDTTDEIGSDYFDDLLNRSFFQISKVDGEETYRMHDLIHDLAQSVSRPHLYQVKDNDPCLFSEKTRHVSLLCKDVEQPVDKAVVNCKKLRTLLSPTDYLKDYGPTLDKLFRTLKFIRVLDLNSSKLSQLPKSVGGLKLLRYLDLSRTEIRTLPDSICTLYNLQTLKLIGCLWLFELPKDFGNLVNLQHFEVEEMFWHKLHVLPPKIGSITGLQNLHAFPVNHKVGYGIDELGKMMHLTGKLHISKLENAVNAGKAKLIEKEGLTEEVFEWSGRDDSQTDEEADEKILEDLHPHSNIKELRIIHYRGASFPSWIRQGLVKNISSISLSHCSKCRVLPLNQLPHLEDAHIKGLLELEEWPEANYHSLYRLKISNCPKLKEIPNCFLNLKVLTIKRCDSLQALPVTPSLMFLILADNLVLADWNEVAELLVLVNVHGQCQPRRLPSYIELLELKIRNCPLLDPLPEYFAPQKLEISGCPLITTLPVADFSRRLQHLALDACQDGTILKTIPDTGSLYSLVISQISNLTALPKWPNITGLKTLYISQCEDLVSLVEEEDSFLELKSLRLLSIRNCPKLVALPEKGFPTTLECLTIGSCNSLKSLGSVEALKNLTSLKDVYIENCPAILSLPEQGLPTSLQHLRIEGCPTLSNQCQKDMGPYWPKIEHIPDLEIESIEVCAAPKPSKKKPWYSIHHRGENSSGDMMR